MAGVPDRLPRNAEWYMSTPVSMMATTLPEPVWEMLVAFIMAWADVTSPCCAARIAAMGLLSASAALSDSAAPVPSASVGVSSPSSLTRVSWSRNALCTPLTPRIASIEPMGALSAKPVKVLTYSWVTSVEASGKAAATASLMEASAAVVSVPSSSWTIMSTTVEESSSTVAGASSSKRDSPSGEVSALSTSPTGSSGAGSLAAAASAADCSDWAASASEPAWWMNDPGIARDVGSAMATAHAPTIASSFAGFFGVICLTPMMVSVTRTGRNKL